MTFLDHPHHDGSELHVSDLTPALGDDVTVRIRVPHTAGVTQVHVRTTPDREPGFAAAEVESRTDTETWWSATVRVHNPVTNYRFLVDGGETGYRWITQSGLVGHDVPDDTDFKLVAHPAPPTWAADQVLYQIFPDRFATSGVERDWPAWAEPAAWDAPLATEHPATMQQVFGGDLPGIEKRLDHLEDLGVTGVYLNPIFPASQNHRYCANDFSQVDPLLGGDEALVSLASAMRDRGMRLIGDLTANHSGDDHTWFETARRDPESAERGFYLWRDYPDTYEAWADVPTLPKFDHTDPELRRRMYEGSDSVTARWVKPPFELDGWRVDAANMAGRFGATDNATHIARAMLATMRAEGVEGYLLAEHCHDATADLQGDAWHGTMNYSGFTRPVWTWLCREDVELDFLGLPVGVTKLDGHATAATMDAYRGRVPWRTTLHNVNLLGSHDTTRFRYVTGDRDRTHVGLALLLTYPGIPSIYYGDEIGLAGANDDASREPMPWHDRDRWDTDTLAFLRQLVALRREHEALRRGGFRWVHVDADVLVFLRETPDERLLVAVARDDHDAVRLSADTLGATRLQPLVGDVFVEASDGVVELPAHGPAAHVWSLS